MVLVPKMAIVALLQDLAMVHPVPDLAMAHPVLDLAMAHLVLDLAMAHLVPDLAMAHPVTVTHVVSVATVVNMVPDPRSVMVQVASLAMERHRAAMVNLLVMAAEVAMVDKGLLDMASHTASRTSMVASDVDSHTGATEQTYKRIMK